MKIWAALRNAWAGWIMILRGEDGWKEQFALTLPGLLTSLVIFLSCAFLAVAVASTYQGMPGFAAVTDALLAQCLWIAAILISVLLNARILRSELRLLDMMVPAIYLLVGYLLVGSLVNLVVPQAVLVLTASLAYPLYRLGRLAGGWPAANAMIFAVLTLVLLVGIPLAFYMLSTAAAGSPT